jgi:REP element-mobilizing transposase RayT
LIDEGVASFLRRFVPANASRQGARVVEIGIVRDHVHVVLELPPTFDVPWLMQGLKGASARIANRDGIANRESLRWAQGYDLRSVGVGQLRKVIEYVRGQNDRHPERAITPVVLQDELPGRAGASAHGKPTLELGSTIDSRSTIEPRLKGSNDHEVVE